MSVGQLLWGAPAGPADGRRTQLGAIATRLAPALGLLALAAVGVVVGVAMPSHSKYVLAFAAAALVGVLALKRVELLYVLLVVVGFLASVRFVAAFTALEVFVIAVVLLREISRGRRLILPGFLIIYCVWFLVLAARSTPGRNELISLRHYLLPPLLALATAAAAREENARRRIVAILLIAALIEAVPIYIQVFLLHRSGDAVTGTLAAGAANAVGLYQMVPATIFFALGVERVWRPNLMFLLAGAVAFCGVLSSSRAIFAFVPAAFGAVAMSYGFSARRSRGARRALALLLPVVVAVPVLIVSYQALFPSALAGLTSVSGIQKYLLAPHPGGALPERGEQLRLALDQANRAGLITALAGQGLGVTRSFGTTGANGYTPVQSTITATNPNDLSPFLSPAQKTAGTWVGIILTEAGWVGVALFLGFLGYLILLGRRARERLPRGSLDRAMMIALPGLAWLTLVGAFYVSDLEDPVYVTMFWPLIGICIAIAAGARSRVRHGGDVAVVGN